MKTHHVTPEVKEGMRYKKTMGKELTTVGSAPAVFEFDDGARTVTDAVVEAVAAAAGDDPLEIEPIHSVVDPDALDALLGQNGRQRHGDVHVTFSFHGYDVTVWDYGRIQLVETGE